MSDQFHINNYVYKKINEEWLECRITNIQNNMYGLYVLKTLTNLNVAADDTQIFPSTIETIRKFKISMVRYTNGYLHMPAVLKAKIVGDYERVRSRGGGRESAVEENGGEDDIDLLIGGKEMNRNEDDERGGRGSVPKEKQTLKNELDSVKKAENTKKGAQDLDSRKSEEITSEQPTSVQETDSHNTSAELPDAKPNKSINSNIIEILDEFRSFMVVNKPMIYLEELDEFIKHVLLCFKILCYYTLFTAEEKRRYGKFDLEKKCNAYYLLRLLAYMHEVLMLDVEDAGAREICFEFYVYLVDFLFVNVREYF
ncbi:hypothetical protein THOM_2357 [Trachipleistophora hominis]|uniref:MRG domain-containing protein n=1 Tax=Trachipleistophora hominis TaxID=72359 RepID=L7JUL7_TRAHO|nr:hypothetical protein THOM_2357 [Trachipleistophora hominis]